MGKRWVYVDAYLLQSERIEELFQYLASHHQKMILCVESAIQLPYLKQLDAFEYIFDVVYQEGLKAIQQDLIKHNRKEKDTVIMMQHDIKDCEITMIGIEDQYGSLENFLYAKTNYDKNLYHKLDCVNIAMMIVLFMAFVWDMPMMLAACLILGASIILILNFFYGVSKGIFHLGQLFEMILDAF